MNCRAIQSKLPDLLFEPESVSADVREHLENCPACREELAGLRATMAAMDAWEAPEPTPYFDLRLQARLREERAAAPAGFFERVRMRLFFNSNAHLRPILAGALAVLLIAGGGTYAGLNFSQSGTTHAQQQDSATVRDLQSLDGNAQVFQQLNAVDDDDDSGDGSANNL